MNPSVLMMGNLCISNNRQKRQPKSHKKLKSSHISDPENCNSPRFSRLDSEQTRFIEYVERYKALHLNTDPLFERKKRENRERFRKIAEQNVKKQVRTQSELLKHDEEKDFVAGNIECSIDDSGPKIEDGFFPDDIRKLSIRNCIGVGFWGTIYLADVSLTGRRGMISFHSLRFFLNKTKN